MKPAIEIKNLGKQYKLSSADPYISLRDVLGSGLRHFFSGKKKNKNFWALQDIDLDILPGERIGIIGRNGAGKSTLLKIISRISPPTKGEVTVRGRVGSLLEVGTGFHPELTGRENIYLNGSVLGLKRAEINRQFDAIVDFSGVSAFIDTPLKQYSSGMQLRLAFSVAAHLEPEILLIDEVLAVGDLEFQKKCMGKMEEVSQRQGRTILFVTHNLDSLRKFCPTAILLDKGKMIDKGPTEKIIAQYVSRHAETSPAVNWNPPVYSFGKDVALHKAWLTKDDGSPQSRFDTTQKIGIRFEYEVLKDDTAFTHGINVFNQEGLNIFNSHDVVTGQEDQRKNKGRYVATVWIPGHLLPEGIFSVSLALFLPNPLDILIHEKNKLSFEVFTDYTKQTARGQYSDEFPGIIRPLLDWELRRNDKA